MSARRSLVPALLLALGLAPATASAAGPYLQSEQINRESGAQGTFTIGWPTYNDEFPSFVSGDGRYASFTVTRSVFASDFPFKPGQGLYVRDIVDNTTRKIAGGDAYAVGLDVSDQKLSFITSERLSTADTNAARDLYVWNGANGQITLLSRADGATGAATGIASAGVLSANGKAAVWGAEDGVYRRTLATNRTEKISGGDFIARPDDYPRYSTQAPADQYLSDDAKVVSTTAGIVTPSRTYPVPVQPPQTGSTLGTAATLISPTGDIAVWQFPVPWVQSETPPPSFTGPLEVLETGSGQRHTFAPTAKVHAFGWINSLAGIGRDGRSVILKTYKDNGPSQRIPNVRLNVWSPETDQVKALGRAGTLSRNQKYVVTNTFEGVYPGPARMLQPTPGNTLPGGQPDLPSANIYAYVGRRCESDYLTGERNRGLVSANPNWVNADDNDPEVPVAASVKMDALDLSNSLLGSRTWQNTGQWEPGEELTWLDNRAFRLRVTVQFKDGRSATALTDFPSEKVCDRPEYQDLGS